MNFCFVVTMNDIALNQTVQFINKTLELRVAFACARPMRFAVYCDDDDDDGDKLSWKETFPQSIFIFG